jgi:multidrug efflux pump subunit AcrB
VSLPGASPTQLETEVTRKVEDAGAPPSTGVKRVTSNVSRAVSSAIEFVLDTDLGTALDDVRDAVTRIRADLPQDIQEPVVAKVEIGGSLMTYTVGSRSAALRAELAGRSRHQQGACTACPAWRWSAARAALTARSASTSTRRRCRPGA